MDDEEKDRIREREYRDRLKSLRKSAFTENSDHHRPIGSRKMSSISIVCCDRQRGCTRL